MPAYSGGNRWVGVLALAPPPVPPPLHRMARARITSRTTSSPYVDIGGRQVRLDVAMQALSLLGNVLGAHNDMSRQAHCFALVRSMRQPGARVRGWPGWAKTAVLAYAADPEAFVAPHAYELKAWGLWSGSPPARARPKRRQQVPTAGHTGRAPRTVPAPNAVRHLPELEIVDGRQPDLLEPDGGLDELPVDAGLVAALAQTGWNPADELRRRWLTLATMHKSYLYERNGVLLVSAELLRMLDSLVLTA
jgi:hypothetical protein